jgi:hypothetical protein
MTANELAEIADGLSCEIPIREWIDNEPKNVMNDIATMLRQQQAEIETLKKELALQRLSDIGQEFESFDRTASHMASDYVSYCELTDEEIMQVYKDSLGIKLSSDMILDFARAILKKANEK